jgi:ABC-type Na+ efflux pump permease subunit
VARLDYRNVRTVLIKELRDTLRDRRTLFAAILLPVIINPLLFIGGVALLTNQAAQQQRQEFKVALINGDGAPKLVRVIRGYTPQMGGPARIPDAATPIDDVPVPEPGTAQVEVVPLPEPIDVNGDGWFDGDDLVATLRALGSGQTQPADGNGKPDFDPEIVTDYYAEWRQTNAQPAIGAPAQRLVAAYLIEAGFIQVAVRLPESFDAQLAGADEPLPAEVIYYGANDDSSTAAGHIRRILRAYTEPFRDEPIEIVDGNIRKGSNEIRQIARFLPYLIILMVLGAAFTPAIDLMAGEKERGTIETLLISPAGREEIMLGKFLTVTITAIVAVALNLASLGVTLAVITQQLSSQMSARSAPAEPAEGAETVTTDADAEDAEAPATDDQTQPATGGADASDTPTPPAGPTAPPGPRGGLPDIPFHLYPIIFVLMVPAAALFGAVALAISAFAKSYREGQYYITPMMIIAIPLSMVSLLPGIELNFFWGMLPIANFSLLFRDMMTEISTGNADLTPELWAFVIQVTVVTAMYAYIALRWATSIFYREDVLFRTAGEFNWKFWKTPGPRRLTPSSGSAFAAFVIAIILFFFVGQGWQGGRAVERRPRLRDRAGRDADPADRRPRARADRPPALLVAARLPDARHILARRHRRRLHRARPRGPAAAAPAGPRLARLRGPHRVRRRRRPGHRANPRTLGHRRAAALRPGAGHLRGDPLPRLHHVRVDSRRAQIRARRRSEHRPAADAVGRDHHFRRAVRLHAHHAGAHPDHGNRRHHIRVDRVAHALAVAGDPRPSALQRHHRRDGQDRRPDTDRRGDPSKRRDARSRAGQLGAHRGGRRPGHCSRHRRGRDRHRRQAASPPRRQPAADRRRAGRADHEPARDMTAPSTVTAGRAWRACAVVIALALGAGCGGPREIELNPGLPEFPPPFLTDDLPGQDLLGATVDRLRAARSMLAVAANARPDRIEYVEYPSAHAYVLAVRYRVDIIIEPTRTIVGRVAMIDFVLDPLVRTDIGLRLAIVAELTAAYGEPAATARGYRWAWSGYQLDLAADRLTLRRAVG